MEQHVVSMFIKYKESLNTEKVVRPPLNNVAAIPEKQTANATFLLRERALRARFHFEHFVIFFET